MCLNSIWFFYNYFFISKYLLVTQLVLKQKKSKLRFLKKYAPYRNMFYAHRFFVVNNFTKMYIHKNIVFTRANSLARAVLVTSKLFRIMDYSRFFSFFFYIFFFNNNTIFFSFKMFYFDFLSLMSYTLDSGFSFYLKLLFTFSQEKKNRRKMIKLLKII